MENKIVGPGIGGGAGSALGVILVVMVPKFTTIVFDATEAALMTAALGVVFAWLLPKAAPWKR